MDNQRSNFERMLAGEPFRNPDPEIIARAVAARALLDTFNSTPQADMEGRIALLKRALVSYAPGMMRSPVTWEFGNIAVGEGCFFNWECIFIDNARITIGNNVAVGPRTQFITAGHPVSAGEREVTDEDGNRAMGAMAVASPITVEDNVWIGAGVMILPGVTIGARSTVGAGSVVTKSIPAGVLAVGNPCRVVRLLDG